MDGRGFSGTYPREVEVQQPEDKRISAELGLLAATKPRSIAGGDVHDFLEALPFGKRRQVARYAFDRYEMNFR